MDIRKLEIFFAVAKELNMTRASKKIFLSQPAVSQAIKELERELKVKLFDRINKKIYLTYEGTIFLKYVSRIINLFEESKLAVLNKTGIKIGASTTIGIYVLPDIIKKFLEVNKHFDISLKIENTANIVNRLYENQIDFAFVEGMVFDENIVKKKVMADELVFICSKTHSFGAKTVNINEFLKEKLIMRETGSGTRQIFEEELLKNEIIAPIAFELGNTEAIKKAVEANMGISCVSKKTVEKELKENRLVQFDLEHIRIMRDFYLLIHRDKIITDNINTFIDFAAAL